MTTRVGDPLVPDGRVARAERSVRALVPGLGEDTAFVTYVQERGPGIDPKGRKVEDAPEVAVVWLRTPNHHPRHVGEHVDDHAKVWLSQWRKRDREYRNNVGQMDPLVQLFIFAARSHVEKLRNWREMN